MLTTKRTITVIVEVEEREALAISRKLTNWLLAQPEVVWVPSTYNEPTKVSHYYKT